MTYGLTNRQRYRFKVWFLEGLREPLGPHASHVHQSSWWQVMCLTGVDYFSTLGYQPGIAFARGRGAVADRDPRPGAAHAVRRAAGLPPGRASRARTAQGSIAMLEELLPRWRGKVFVLCLLGFAATDFVITITLSAADATAHIVENPFVPAWLRPPGGGDAGAARRLLGAVFLRGFKEAIGLAVGLVGRLPRAQRWSCIGTALRTS